FAVGRMFGNQFFQSSLRLVGAFQAIETERALDLRIALHWRGRRQPIIDIDRQLDLLDRFIEIGERQQRHRVRRREIKRKLEIDEAEILAAAPSERRAETLERLGGARLGRINEQRNPPTRIDVGLILEIAGQKRDAGRRYERVYKIDPNQLRVVQAYGGYLSRQGSKDE